MDKAEVCVVFDLDDTLYLERDYAQSGFRAVGEWCAARLGIEGVQLRAQSLFEGGRRGDIFDAVLDEMGVARDSRIVSEMVKIYREHVPSIQLAPDALECLSRLEKRVYLALLTDGNPVSQRAKIQALHLESRVDALVVTGDWGSEYFKPHVRGYRRLESELHSCIGRFVYVADNPAKDFFAPRSLAWKAIRVRRRGGLHENIECSSDLIHAEVSDLESVPSLLSGMYSIHF